MPTPRVVLLFSGKRKSGKDFITDKLIKSLPVGTAVVLRVSGPLKKEYAAQHNLDYEEMLTSSGYKEEHRLAMIRWSEKIRNENPAYFIEKAIEMYNAEQFPVWVVSDTRRVSDLEQFKSKFGEACLTVRVSAALSTRSSRGWIFTAGVDDAESECGLDGITHWDYEVDTTASDEGSVLMLLKQLQKLCRDRGVFS